NVAPMVDFNHTIVELVGNEVMVGCRGGDGASEHNRDQRHRENDLDGKFHENPPVRDRPFGPEKCAWGTESRKSHGQQSRKSRPGHLPELSKKCQRTVTFSSKAR